jgi:hypothetical protein
MTIVKCLGECWNYSLKIFRNVKLNMNKLYTQIHLIFFHVLVLKVVMYYELPLIIVLKEYKYMCVIRLKYMNTSMNL